MIKNLKEIETALGLKEGDFKTLYDAAEEKVIDITPFEIVKKDDLNTRIENVKKEAGTAAVEIAVKKARDKFNLDFTGKTFDNFADSFKVKVLADAKIEPEKKVKELENDLGTMRTNYETEKQKRERLESDYKQKDNDRTINDSILAEIPDNIILPKGDILTIFKAKNQIAFSDDNKIVFSDSNGVIKNKTTLNPLSIKEVMTDFITPYIKAADGGDGGKDNPGVPKAGTMAAFYDEMEKAGNTPGSQKFNEEMARRIKDKTLTN